MGLAARVFVAVILAGNGKAPAKPVHRQSLQRKFWTPFIVYVSLYVLMTSIGGFQHRDYRLQFDPALLNVSTSKSVLVLGNLLDDTNNRPSELSRVLEYVGKMVTGAAFVGGVSVLPVAIGRAIGRRRRQLITRFAALPASGEDARVVGAFVFVAINALQKAGEVARAVGFWILVALIGILMMKLEGAL